MADAPRIFRARWLPLMRREVEGFAAARPALAGAAEAACGVRRAWLRRRLAEMDAAIAAIVPDAA
jgi:hypothetical protein